MTTKCLVSAMSLVLVGLFWSFTDADVFLHNPRGSNNRLNKAGANRANNNRLFDSQNNAKGGYNVGDEYGASNSEETQFNMHYFQSGEGSSRRKGKSGKSLLKIEWTNQHGCSDKDLNCNFVLQYRCQDDEKHQTLNSHSIRNGYKTNSPGFRKKTFTTRSQKNARLRSDSSRFSRGLHESWEWYDKCVKRIRLGINCPAQTTGENCCVFPFIYKNKRYDSCTRVKHNRPWCATTSNYDKDRKWGNCQITHGNDCAAKTTTGQCCVFPFIYKRKRYNFCTKKNHNRLWCATTSNYDKDRKWGNCNNAQFDEPQVSENYPRAYQEKGTGGLFTADQDLKGKTTIYTRQNPNGGRSGYECPDERDYYPYWYPTDWTDIAVFTDNVKMCKYYKKESFNVKPKAECLEYYNSKADGFRHYSVYNNKADCERNGGFWVSFSNYLEEYPQLKTERECKRASSEKLRLFWAIPYRSEDIDNLKMTGDNVQSLKRCLVKLDPPDCKKTPHTRTNHLGNAHKVVPFRYTWVIPHFPSGHEQRCVIRLRYNISTGDYPPFDTFGDKNDDPDNGIRSPVQNNPEVKVANVQMPLQLAINTAQFGRTFQDRSHLFKLVPRPKSVSNRMVIHNLNVRGKRGNIVQVYPAVEYDFFPKRMTISSSSSLVHIQWTGSNTNPKGNAGQGTAGTDRNNMVEMKDPSVNYPLPSGEPLTMFSKAQIVWSSDDATKTNEDLVLSMASSGYYNSVSQYRQKKAINNELNNAPASYRGMLLKFAPGRYYYMCSRNNNFSNRNQKGRLLVRG